MTIFSGGGGFGTQVLGGQRILMERVYAIPKPGTDRLVAGVINGLSTIAIGPNNTMRLSRAIRAMDDGFLIQIYTHGVVQSQVNSRSIQVVGTGAAALALGDSLPNGTNVSFERQTDGVVIFTRFAPASPSGISEL